MRFATTTEGLGVNLISAVLTLLAFLPVLVRLSSSVTELPLIGAIPYPLVFAAVSGRCSGPGALALIGIRLPGIEFFNQRVEAAYRKELVLGEDDAARADPPTVSELFAAIRHNYFRLYLNFMYFNVGRIVYLQTDVIFPYILLGPTIVAGKITLWFDESDPQRLHAGQNLVPIPRQCMEHDRRADFDLSAVARLRGRMAATPCPR